MKSGGFEKSATYVAYVYRAVLYQSSNGARFQNVRFTVWSFGHCARCWAAASVKFSHLSKLTGCGDDEAKPLLH